MIFTSILVVCYIYYWSFYNAKYILFVLSYEALLENIPQWLDVL